jgi:hypothetical protein
VDLGAASAGCGSSSTPCLGTQCGQPTSTSTSTTPPPPPPPPPPPSDAGGVDAAPSSQACANPVPLSSFNLLAFQQYIEPILEGVEDYTDLGGGVRASCTDTTCHGSAAIRSPSLVLQAGQPAQNLSAIACFIDLKHPSQSPFLVCPQGVGTTCAYPDGSLHQHPGKAFYHSQTDPNLQLVSSWVDATQGAANMWDFAYFATQIEPIFGNSTFGGEDTSRSCNSSECHGIQRTGQAPGNGTDFPLLESPVSKADHLDDYWSAANQLNFYFSDPNPEGAINATIPGAGSFLFLYPAQVISDPPSVVAHPYSNDALSHIGSSKQAPNFNLNDTTEVPAPGGAATAFFVSEWAAGLKPDVQGDLVNWLVAGTYAFQNITQQPAKTLVDEQNGTPQIFDDAGTNQPNGGEWGAIFVNNTPVLQAGQEIFSGGINPQVKTVDFNQANLGDDIATSSRVAYAVLYLYNVTASDLATTITVSLGQSEKADPFAAAAGQPNNDQAELLIGLGDSGTQIAANGSSSRNVTLHSIFASGGGPVRVMVKELAPANEANFQFQAQILQANGQPIPQGDVYVRLDANGGM